MESIGTRIKKIRLQRGLTMIDLGEGIGTKSSVISNWENEKKIPSAQMVIALSNFLNVTTDWILKGEEGEQLGSGFLEQDNKKKNQNLFYRSILNWLKDETSAINPNSEQELRIIHELLMKYKVEPSDFNLFKERVTSIINNSDEDNTLCLLSLSRTEQEILNIIDGLTPELQNHILYFIKGVIEMHSSINEDGK